MSEAAVAEGRVSSAVGRGGIAAVGRSGIAAVSRGSIATVSRGGIAAVRGGGIAADSRGGITADGGGSNYAVAERRGSVADSRASSGEPEVTGVLGLAVGHGQSSGENDQNLGAIEENSLNP